MEVTQALQDRRSVRAFTTREVTLEQVRSLLQAAGRAPSGGNLQPWQVIVVRGEAKRAVEQLTLRTLAANPRGEADEFQIYPSGLTEPYVTRRERVGQQLYELLGIAREDRAARMAAMARNFSFFDAPVGLFFVIDRQMGHGQWAHLGMFMQSIALLAVEAGLGTCMQEAWAMVRDSLRQHFALGEQQIVYCGMALGYPEAGAPVNQLVSERVSVDDFASFHGF